MSSRVVNGRFGLAATVVYTRHPHLRTVMALMAIGRVLTLGAIGHRGPNRATSKVRACLVAILVTDTSGTLRLIGRRRGWPNSGTEVSGFRRP